MAELLAPAASLPEPAALLLGLPALAPALPGEPETPITPAAPELSPGGLASDAEQPALSAKASAHTTGFA